MVMVVLIEKYPDINLVLNFTRYCLYSLFFSKNCESMDKN